MAYFRGFPVEHVFLIAVLLGSAIGTSLTLIPRWNVRGPQVVTFFLLYCSMVCVEVCLP